MVATATTTTTKKRLWNGCPEPWQRPAFLLPLMFLLASFLLLHCEALVPPEPPMTVHLTGDDLVGSWRVTLLDRSGQPFANPSERYKQTLSHSYASREVATIRLNEDGTFHLEECEVENSRSSSPLCQGGVWSYRTEPTVELLLASMDHALLWRGPLQVTLHLDVVDDAHGHATTQLGVARGEITYGKFRHANPHNPGFFQDPILLHGRSSRRGEFGMQQLLGTIDDQEGMLQPQAFAKQEEEQPPPRAEEAKEEEQGSWPELLQNPDQVNPQQTEEEEGQGSLEEQVNQQQENIAESIKELAQALQHGEIHPLEYLEELSRLLGGIDYQPEDEPPAAAPKEPHVPNTEPPFDSADFYNKSFSLAATRFPTAGENLENHHRFTHLDPTLGLGIHSLDVAFFENNTFSATNERGRTVRGEFGIAGDDHGHVWFQVTGHRTKNKRGYIGQITTYANHRGEPVYSVYGNYYKIQHMEFPEEPEGTFVLQQARNEEAETAAAGGEDSVNYADLFHWDFQKEIFETPWEEDPDAFQ